MTIVEYQNCTTDHECRLDMAKCATRVREYILPDHQREAWHGFFDYLVAHGEIQGWIELD